MGSALPIQGPEWHPALRRRSRHKAGCDTMHSSGKQAQPFQRTLRSSGTTNHNAREQGVKPAVLQTPSPWTGWKPDLGDPPMEPLRA